MKTDPVSQAYKTFNQAIDRVLKNPPGPARWRACVDMWLTLSPSNKVQYKQLIKENAQIREELNKFGLSGDKMYDPEKNLRSALAFPHSLYYLIERADPMAFKEKKNAPLMFKELKELTTREVY
jgi:hypothetical protein